MFVFPNGFYIFLQTNTVEGQQGRLTQMGQKINTNWYNGIQAKKIKAEGSLSPIKFILYSLLSLSLLSWPPTPI